MDFNEAKAYKNLQEAVGEDLYKQNKKQIEAMSDWDKVMLEFLGLDGYKQLLEMREKRKSRRLLAVVASVAIVSLLGIAVLLLKLQA